MDAIPKSLQPTYEAIFQDPAPTDLDWKTIRKLVAVLANCSSEANGIIRCSRRGRTLTLHPEHHQGAPTAEHLALIRRFLEGPSSTDNGAPDAQGGNLVVVMDRIEARIYRLETPVGADKLAPYDPSGAGRTLRYMQDSPDAPPGPEREGFHEAMARTLRAAGSITIMARGKPAVQSAEALIGYLKKNHPPLAGRVTSIITIEANPTPAQLLAHAKELRAAT